MKRTYVAIGIAVLFILAMHCAPAFASGEEAPLHKAVLAGDIGRAGSLLANGADVNALDLHGMAPLHYAAGMCDRGDIVKLLLDNGADIQKKSGASFTPILFAAQKDCADIVMLLINSGADVKIKFPGNGNETPLHRAAFVCGTETVSALIKAGADVNAVDDDGFTPLFQGSLLDKKYFDSDTCVKTMSILLDNGAEVNVRDNKGGTLLMRRAYEAALYGGAENVAQDPAVKLLLERGAVVDPLAATLLGDAVTLRKYLDAGGGDIEYTVSNFDGMGDFLDVQSMLQCASIGNHPEIIEILLEHGKAFIVPKNQAFDKPWGYVSAIETAVRGRRKTAYITLMKHRDKMLDVNDAWMWDNSRLLYQATKFGNPDMEMVKMLKSDGSAMTVPVAACLGDKDFIDKFIADGGDINAADNGTLTALALAVKCGNKESISYLLEKGADINQLSGGMAPIHWAVHSFKPDIAALLLDRGADVNRRVDYSGDTALHMASRWGLIDIIQILLEHGADITVSNNEGWTPLDIARYKENSNLIEGSKRGKAHQ